MRAAIDGHFDFGVEWLEKREMLAITVTPQNLANYRNASGGGYTFTDSESITVSPGLLIDAAGGNITFTAPTITIGDGAKLLSKGKNGDVDGKITLKAEDTQAYLSSTTGDAVRSWFLGTSGASVALGANVKVDSGAFSIIVRSGDEVTRNETFQNAFVNTIGSVGSIPDILFGAAGSVIGTNELLALPVSAIVKEPTSTIDIGDGSSIASSGDVSITGWSSAYAWVHASWMLLAKATNAAGAAIGVAYSNAKSTTNVGVGVQIVSAGSVDLKTDVYSYTNARANTGLNTGIGDTNPDSVGISAAVTIQNSTSTIHLKPGSLVRAAGQVRVNARDDEQMWGEAYVASYRDGSVGLDGAVALSNSDVRVTVDGTIEAGQVFVPKALEFNPAFQVDFSNSSIGFPSDIACKTGDEVVYSSNGGGSIPGLRTGATYFTIVDTTNTKSLRLAATKADALAGKAIDFGAGYPTLGGAGSRGRLPIVAVNPSDDTIDFESGTWADGTRFSEGETVTFAPVAGQFIGFKNPDGTLGGPLAAGSYTIRIVTDNTGFTGTRIRLEKGGVQVDLDTSPLLTKADGTNLRIKAFDLLNSTVAFGDVVSAMAIANAATLTYHQAVGQTVPGLVDGRTYYAIVDPATPGLIRLAATERQAQAANPAIQGRNPGIEFTVPATQDAPEVKKTVVPVRFDPGIGLVFDKAPNITDGQAVIYRAVPGKPIAGLVDGATYFAYNQLNPYFKVDWPEYIVGLRTAAYASLPLVDFNFTQSLEVAGVNYEIGAANAQNGTLTLSLNDVVKATVANAAGLGGGAVKIRDIPAGSVIVQTQATGGTWRMKVPTASGTVTTEALPWNATAADVAGVLNRLGKLNVKVTDAFGTGSPASPWVLIGEGFEWIEFDSSALSGGTVGGRMTEEGLQAISTTAMSGNFTLTLDVAGKPATTGPIAAGATTAAVSQALAALAGVSPWVQAGAGTEANPWLISAWRQPLATGQAAVFRDGFGAETIGIVDGQSYSLVVLPASPPGTLVVRLAATVADATAAAPVTLDLTTALVLGGPSGRQTADMLPLSGKQHTLSSTVEGSIVVRAEGIFGDGQSACVQTGGYPDLFDLLSTRKDLIIGQIIPRIGKGAFQSIRGIGSGGISSGGKNFWSALKRFWKSDAGILTFADAVQQPGGASAKDSLGLAGSFSFLKANRSVQTIISSSATLVTPGRIIVNSELTEQFQSEATSSVSKPDSTRVAVALAVNLAQATTTCRTIVQSGAKITGGEGVFFDSHVSYPWMFQSIRDRFADMTSWTDVFGVIFSSITIDINNKPGTHQARSSTGLSSDAAGKNAQIDNALAGSVSLVTVSNRSETILEDGVEINQLESAGGKPLVIGADQPVSVTASTEMLQLGYASGWSADWLAGSPSIGNLDGQSADSKTGLGFGAAYYGLDNTTRAVIGGGAPLADGELPRVPTSPTKIGFGGGGLTVDATNWGLLIQIGMSGATSSNLALSGSASVIDASRSPQKVESAILPNSTLVPIIRRRGATAGKVKVSSNDVSYLIPIAGSLNRGGESMVGASTAIALVDRHVISRIGDGASEDSGGSVALTTAGNVTVEANAGGAITPTAVAGAKKTANNAFTGEGQFVFDERTGVEFQKQFIGENALTVDRFGIGASGAVAISNVNDTVTANVNHSGTMTTGAAAKLAVAATNTTTILANTGSLAMRTAAGEEKVSVGLSGAVSLIIAESTVEASLRRASVDGFMIDISALNSRSIGTAAASGAGGAVGGSGSFTVNFAGSVALNLLTTSTIAMIDRVTGRNLIGTRVAATTNDLVWTVAGSFVGNVSSILERNKYQLGEPLIGADNGRSLAVGASVALLSSESTTKANVAASNLAFAQGNLDVGATESSTVITASGGGSYVNSGGTAKVVYASKNNAGSSVAGFVAVVTMDPTLEASISDSTVTMADTGGDVSVVATSALLLVTASGGFVINRDGSGTLSTSIGAAVTVVNSTNRSTGRIERSSVSVPKGKVRVRSTNGNPSDDAWKSLDPIFTDLNMPEAGSGAVWSFAVGAVAADSTLSVAASVNVTKLNDFVTATIADNSTVTAAAGSVEVTAIDEAKVRTVAGSIATTAFSGDRSALSAGAAVLYTSLGGGATSTIDSSSVTAGTDPASDTSGRVAVMAAEKPDLLTIAAAGVISGQNALSASLVFNDLTGRVVTAGITGSDSNRSAVSATKGVVVTAREETNLTAVSGQVAIPASTSAAVAAGAAGAINNVGVDVTAVIEYAAVSCPTGDVSVQTVTGGTINAWAVGVSAALSGSSGGGLIGALPFSFVGAGSFALNTVVRRDTAAVRNKASVTAKSLSVTASDTGAVFAVAGALAAQASSKVVSVAVGVSVANNEIGTADARGFVKALIDNSSVSLTGGDLVVQASSSPAITSWTIAGTGQVSKSDSVSVGLSGAGAGNTNSLAVDTLAAITGTASVNTDKSGTVSAIDASKVDSNAGGAGLGVTLGSSAAVGVTVGAARNVITVTNTARAVVDSANITAGGDVAVRSLSNQNIHALAFGVALNVAAASGGAGVSAAGSGAAATVTLKTSTTAEVVSGMVTAGSAGNGSVTVSAIDTPMISSQAGAGSLAVAVSSTAAVALAAGVVLGENSITNNVVARIGRDGQAGPTVTANGTGRVEISARSAATVDQLGVAVAASAAISPNFSAAAAAAYAEGTTTVRNTVTATIATGQVKASNVLVMASDAHSITNTLGVGAGVLSLNGGSVGLSVTESTIADTVTASIGAASVTATGGDVTVAARSANKLDTRSVATSLAIAIGGGGTSGQATSRDKSIVTALVANGAQLTAAAGSLKLISGGDGSGSFGSVKAKSDGGSGGLITVGRVRATAESSVARSAAIGDGVDLSKVGRLQVYAQGQVSVGAESYAVDVGGLAVQANESNATSAGSVKAIVGANVILPRSVFVNASGGTRFDVTQGGGFGGLIGGGSNFATASSTMAIEAILSDGVLAAPGQRVDRLEITATQDDTSNIGATNGSGTVIGVAKITAELTDKTSTKATIGKVGSADGATPLNVGVLSLSSSRSQNYSTTAKSWFGGGLAGGIPVTRFDASQADSRAVVAAGANINAASTVSFGSKQTILKTTDGDSAQVSGGGIVSSAGGEAGRAV